LGLGLILLGVVLFLNVLISLVRRWRERSELGDSRMDTKRLLVADLSEPPLKAQA
jgi:hypothetical protein